MRYIDLNVLLRKRRDWGKGKELWKNQTLKSDFRDYFYNKCWYSESLLSGSDAAIDHFRPKAMVRQYMQYRYNELLRNTGYSWLKNNPSNYRFSCTYANRRTGEGGKSCYFPLSDTSEWLTEDGNEHETPLLLDPCNHDDVRLLSFMGNEVIPTTNEPFCILRVEVSSSIYNLNNSTIKSPRAHVWENVVKTLDEYERGSINKAACLRWLNDAVDRSAPFSACAIACVNSLAPDEIIAELDLTL